MPDSHVIDLKASDKSVPDVSIILPIYNAEPYLEEALDSAINQTYRNLEIICVNDGSTDSSLSIIERYAQRDARIVIDDGSNGGYGKAMNRGLDRARGEFIAILEPDDILKPTMIEVLLPVARAHDLDFVRADFYRFTTGDSGKHAYTVIPICHNREGLYNKVLNPQENLDLFNVRMQNWTGLTRRSFIEGHHIRFHESPGARFQDNSFWFQTYCWATRVEYVPQAFYCHRDDNPNSSTNRSDLTFAMLDEWKWIREYLAQFPERERDLARIYQFRKFHNCNFAFSKLADDLQLPYLERYSDELKHALDAGELDLAMFSVNEQKSIRALMDDPVSYLTTYREKRQRGTDLESAKKMGKKALFMFYVREEGLASALSRSVSHIAHAISRRLVR